MYVGCGQPLERILDARQVAQAERRVPLPQTALRAEACDFHTVATLRAFTCCLRHAIHFTGTATYLKPATPWQVQIYAAFLEAYTAASEAYRRRAESPREKVELELQRPQKHRRTLKRMVWRGVQMRFGTRSVAECVLSKDPGNLFGHLRLGFHKDVQYDELSSEESVRDSSKTAKAPGSSTTTMQTRAKGPTGWTATKVAPSVTTGLLVVAPSFAKPTTRLGMTPRSSHPTTAQTTASTAKALSISSSANANPRLPKASTAKGTLAEATTPSSSIVPLPLAQSSALRNLSESQTIDSSSVKTVVGRTRRKGNANEITDDEWIVVRSKLAEVRDRLSHVHVEGVPKGEIE